jgi:hypothetical protein
VGSGPTVGGAGWLRLAALVGHIGMRAVLRAEDLRRGQRVALKVLAADLAEDEWPRPRFWLSRGSPPRSTMQTSCRLPRRREGLLYIAMRYAKGGSAE